MRVELRSLVNSLWPYDGWWIHLKSWMARSEACLCLILGPQGPHHHPSALTFWTVRLMSIWAGTTGWITKYKSKLDLRDSVLFPIPPNLPRMDFSSSQYSWFLPLQRDATAYLIGEILGGHSSYHPVFWHHRSHRDIYLLGSYDLTLVISSSGGLSVGLLEKKIKGNLEVCFCFGNNKSLNDLPATSFTFLRIVLCSSSLVVHFGIVFVDGLCFSSKRKLPSFLSSPFWLLMTRVRSGRMWCPHPHF